MSASPSTATPSRTAAASRSLDGSGRSPDSRPIQPRWLRACHWINVVAVLVMVTSGWRIFNASPFFGFEFPTGATLGGWLGGALQWHFAGMWLLIGNGVVYLALNLATGRFRSKFFPVTPSLVWHDFKQALKGRLSHADPRRYNGVQRLAYLFVVADIAVIFVSGLVLWKSVQFGFLREALGGYETARRIHFFGMAALLAFVVVHVVMVALVPRTLLTMIRDR